MHVFVGNVLLIKIAFKDIFRALLIKRMIIPGGSGITLHLKLLLVKVLQVVHFFTNSYLFAILSRAELRLPHD